jgi:hypothetical protein
MSKTLKDNPYSHIRKGVPKPTRVHNCKNDYKRSKIKKELQQIIKEDLYDSSE